MLQFIVAVILVLAITAPNFFAVDVYVIDKSNEGILYLEPLDDRDLPTLELSNRTFPEGREGQVVTVQSGGNFILCVCLAPERNKLRQLEITQLLEDLTNSP